MKKFLAQFRSWSGEQQALFPCSLLFLGIIFSSWIYVMHLRQTVASSNAVANVDSGALVEVEKIRNTADSQIASSRAYFLLGSKVFFEKQKKEKQDLIQSLTDFETKYNLPNVPDIVRRIQKLLDQQQDYFDQALEFREKQTESKIVGQFYQSKTSLLATQMNTALNEISSLHKDEMDRARSKAHQSAENAENLIPQGMAWLTGLVGFLFLALASIVIRMLREKKRQLAERDRLIAVAKNSVLARDEVVAAISEDFKEPLREMSEVAVELKAARSIQSASESADLIQSYIHFIQGLIKDVGDLNHANLSQLTLRMDQLEIDTLMDDAIHMLQPLAKRNDVRLQFDPVHSSSLAFCDRERVMRVLSSLIGNAIKFSPKHSKVVIKVRSDQQFAHISIADSGPGIPDKQLATLFDHFWQARQTAPQGAGINLAVAKVIIESHGGILRAESPPGHGCTFMFSLPRRRPVGAQLRKPTLNPKPVVRIRPRQESPERHA